MTLIRILHVVSPTARLSILITATKDMIDLITSMWVKKARDVPGTNSFQILLFRARFPSGASSNFLPYIVDRCDGGADDVERLVFLASSITRNGRRRTGWLFGTALHS